MFVDSNIDLLIRRDEKATALFEECFARS